MEKIDFKKKYKTLYKASEKKITIETVPEFQYIMQEGEGSPENNSSFGEAIGALYSTAYSLKFMLKYDEGLRPKGYFDFVIPPLETQWWGTEGEFKQDQPDTWRWNCMVMQPDYIDGKLIKVAHEEIAKSKMKKKEPVPELGNLKLKKLPSFKVVQTLHIGPYNEVGKIYEKLGQYIKENGYTKSHKGHEIYLNDPRRTAPEKLKTIVRLPI